jgi:hypothetical protein
MFQRRELYHRSLGASPTPAGTGPDDVVHLNAYVRLRACRREGGVLRALRHHRVHKSGRAQAPGGRGPPWTNADMDNDEAASVVLHVGPGMKLSRW